MLKQFKTLYAIDVYYNYEISQMDIKIVFLSNNLLEDVQMTHSNGFFDPNDHEKVFKVHKSIYRLKQTS